MAGASQNKGMHQALVTTLLIYFACGVSGDEPGLCGAGKCVAPEVAPLGRVVSWQPRVVVFDNFLSQDEVRAMVNKSSYVTLKKSKTWSGRKGKRTSKAAFLTSRDELGDPKVRRIKARIAAATHIPPQNGEALQVQRYESGGYYTAHLDAKETVLRASTFLIYLTTTEGGETFFPRTSAMFREETTPDGEEGSSYDLEGACAPKSGVVKVKPVAGRAVYFHNMDLEGEFDEESLHGSCPTRDQKILLQQWLYFTPQRMIADPSVVGLWRLMDTVAPERFPEEYGRDHDIVLHGGDRVARLTAGVMGLAAVDDRVGTPQNPLQHAALFGTEVGCGKVTNPGGLLARVAKSRQLTASAWFNIVSDKFGPRSSLGSSALGPADLLSIFSARVRGCAQMRVGLSVTRKMTLLWEAGRKKPYHNPSLKLKVGRWYHAAVVYAGPGTVPVVYVSQYKREGIETTLVTASKARPVPVEPLSESCEGIESAQAEVWVGCRPSSLRKQEKVRAVVMDVMLMDRAVREDEVGALAKTVENANDAR